MKKKVLFIIFPFNQWVFKYLTYGSSLVASSIDKEKYDVYLYSYDASGEEPDVSGYDYVLISSFRWGSINEPRHVKITKEIYKRLQDFVSRIEAKTIVGGTMIEHHWDNDLKCDLVVKGRADTIINSLMDKTGYEKSNISGELCKTINYKILNIQDFQISHKNIFETLNIPLEPTNDYVSIIFTRYSSGCNKRCAFCNNARTDIDFTDIDVIKDCILSYVENGFNVISFIDTYANSSPRLIEKLCNWIVRENIDIMWSHSTRLSHDDPDFYKMLFDGGCRQLFNGMESMSPSMLKEIQKDIKVDKILRNLEMVNDAGIINSCNLIVGLPNETEEQLYESINNIVSVKDLIDEVIINKFIMYADTDYHRFPKKFDLIVATTDSSEMIYYEKRGNLKYSDTKEKRKKYEIIIENEMRNHNIEYRKLNQHLIFSLYKQLGSKEKVREVLRHNTIL